VEIPKWEFEIEIDNLGKVGGEEPEFGHPRISLPLCYTCKKKQGYGK
jgi:hypothetical protein